MIKIYTDKEMDLREALIYMTDDWIADGQYCAATVLTMRDALLKLLDDLEKQQKAMNQLEDYVVFSNAYKKGTSFLAEVIKHIEQANRDEKANKKNE